MTDTHTAEDTALLLSAIRSAVLRARLDANEAETIGLALKAGMIDPDGAISWLVDSGLASQVAAVVEETPL